jgi:hypothetical protein
LAFSGCCVVEGQDFWVAVLVQTWGAFTATFVAFTTWAAFTTPLATFTTFCALTARFALFASITALATLFAGHAFVARFSAGFGLGFRCGVVVEGGLAFGIAWFTTAAAVAVLAWTATFAACRAFATGLNAFGVALVAALCIAAFGTAFWTIAAFGAVTTSATATTAATSTIGVAAITALTAFAWLFVADGGLGFFFCVAAEQTSEPTPPAA